MVCLQTWKAQQRYISEHKEEILASGHRFAVVEAGEVRYYDSEAKLYRDYPCFSPDAEPTYGTPPFLIDIDEVNNTPRHKKRILRERIGKFNKDLAALLERGDKLAAEEELLKGKKSK